MENDEKLGSKIRIDIKIPHWSSKDYKFKLELNKGLSEDIEDVSKGKKEIWEKKD
jgi:hypothetical protein